jgi:membrane-associated phospholipid phosphatase
VKLANALFTLALVSLSPSLARAENAPSSARWHGGVLVDSPVRSALRATTPAARHAANVESNALLYSMVATPTLNAAMNAPSFSDAAGLMLVSAETFAVTTGLVMLIKAVTKRERPYATAAGLSAYCVEHPRDEKCKADRNASFFSGHSATAFAGAGLVCMQQMALGPKLATIGCGSAMTLAGATALLRIIADKHYATDTLVGAVVGIATGMLLPYALHFASWAPIPIATDMRASAVEPARVAAAPQTAFQLAPWGTPGGAGMALGFAF